VAFAATLGLAGCFASFGPGTGSDADRAPETEHSEAEPLLFGARTENRLTVVEVDPVTEQVQPFAGPLPEVDPQRHDLTRIWVSRDKSRVMARVVNEESDRERLLASDGGPWRVLHAGKAPHQVHVSPGLSWIWIQWSREQPGAERPEKRVRVLSFEGDERMVRPYGAWYGSWFVDYAPGDEALLWLRDETELVLRRPDGRSTVLAGPSIVEGNVHARLVHRTFSSSLILEQAHPTLTWIDFDGQPLDVEGFAGRQDHTHGSYQIEGGVLSKLSDRSVERLQRVPSGTSGVLGHAADFAVLRGSDRELQAVNEQGEVLARFTPEPSTRQPETLRHFDGRNASGRLLDKRIDQEGALLAFRVSHGVYKAGSGNHSSSGESVEVTLDVWHFDGERGSSKRLRSGPPPDFYPDALVASGTARVFWVQDTRLMRYDAHTDEQSAVPSDYAFFHVYE
jgi:hypothetical protein